MMLVVFGLVYLTGYYLGLRWSLRAKIWMPYRTFLVVNLWISAMILSNVYLLRGILMSTWGFLPAVFRPFRTVFPGLGAGFLNLGGKMGRTAKKRGKNEQKWARNGLKRVGVS